MRNLKQNTIIDLLLENKICFSIGASVNGIASGIFNNGTKSYFVTILKKDYKLIAYYFEQLYGKINEDEVGKKIGFKKSTHNEYLLEKEIDRVDFNTLRKELVIVVENEFGFIYELKNKSFKEYYTAHKQEEERKFREQLKKQNKN